MLDNLFKVKKKLLHISFSINCEEVEHLVGLFLAFGDRGIQLQDLLWETQAAASLSGSLSALSQVQVKCQLPCYLALCLSRSNGA